MKLQTANFKLLTAFAVLCLLASALCPLSWASGSWIVDGEVVQTLEVTVDDPDALHTDGSRTMNAPLVFDSSVSSAATGLFKATVPWDSQYEFFTFNETYETIVLSPTVSSLGFQAADLIFHGNGIITYPGEGTSISFEERTMYGGWYTPTVENDAFAIMNRSYADTRYLRRTEGITVNHTIQAGDVLQIQNGIITAINP